MRALTSRSTRSLQAPSKTAASSTERKRRLVAFMAIPSVLVMACSHRGCLDIHLAGIDDLVLVAGRALDRLALGLVDPAQLDLELLAERADLDRLGLGLIADAAHFHLVDARLDAVLGRLEFTLLVNRYRGRGLLDRYLGIDHVDHRAFRALGRDRLLAAVDELHRAANVRGATRQQQGGQGKECSYVHDSLSG